jgi:hypothetical protein
MNRFKVVLHIYKGFRKQVKTLILLETDYHDVPSVIGQYIQEYHTDVLDDDDDIDGQMIKISYEIKTITVIHDELLLKGKVI